jgi:hypothetical protein
MGKRRYWFGANRSKAVENCEQLQSAQGRATPQPSHKGFFLVEINQHDAWVATNLAQVFKLGMLAVLIRTVPLLPDTG